MKNKQRKKNKCILILIKIVWESTYHKGVHGQKVGTSFTKKKRGSRKSESQNHN